MYRGSLAHLEARQDVVLRALGGHVPDGFWLEVTSDIPVSRGLGSSGAAAVAGAALAHLVEGKPVAPLSVFAAARATEGHPDNAGPAVFGGLVLVAEHPTKLQLHAALRVACAVPDAPVDTRQARELLPARLVRRKAVAQAGRAAALVLGLTRGDADLVRYGMIDEIAVPRRRRLIPGYDAAEQAGRATGAFGVTISGSGSTVMAVCAADRAEEVAAAMAEALVRAHNPARPFVPAVTDGGLQVG